MRPSIVFLFVLWGLHCNGALAEPIAKPNIIFIVADDLGYGDLGFNGVKDFKTPYIDALARSGVICRNGYATHPFCSPSRAGLLTGRYQHRFGFEGNPTSKTPDAGLPRSETTIANVLASAGYDTAAIGKWHLGEQDHHHPCAKGFDRFFGLLGGARSYFKTNDLRWSFANRKGKRPRTPSSRKGYLTDLITDEAVSYIENGPRNFQSKEDKPFFLYLAYTAPHGPLEASEYWLEKVGKDFPNSRRRTYAAMVAALDDGIGKVVKALKDSGNADNTLIFFFSDNGGIAPVNAADNRPFRGIKGTLLEGGIHVPYVVAWPGHIKPNCEFNSPVMTFDAFSTAVAAAGAIDARQRDAVNLLPYLLESKQGPVHPALYWRCGNGFQLAMRQGANKFLHVDGMPDRMFDLEADQSESSAKPVDFAMKTQAARWSKGMPWADFTALGTKHEEAWRALGLRQPPKARRKPATVQRR